MGVRIKAKKQGFRRAGLAHYGTVDYPDGVWTPEQLAALKAEPNLVVTEISEDEERGAASRSAGGGAYAAPTPDPTRAGEASPPHCPPRTDSAIGAPKAPPTAARPDDGGEESAPVTGLPEAEPSSSSPENSGPIEESAPVTGLPEAEPSSSSPETSGPIPAPAPHAAAGMSERSELPAAANVLTGSRGEAPARVGSGAGAAQAPPPAEREAAPRSSPSPGGERGGASQSAAPAAPKPPKAPKAPK